MPNTRLHFTVRSGDDNASKLAQFNALITFARQSMRDGIGNRAWVFSAVNRDNNNVMGLIMASTESQAREQLLALAPAVALSDITLPTDVPNDGYPAACLSANMTESQMVGALNNLGFYLPVLNPALAS